MALWLASGASVPVVASPISSWGVPQMTAHCADDSAGNPGLACVSSAGSNGRNGTPADVVDTPFGGTATIGSADTVATVRASIYDATGMDPGELLQLGKVDGSPGNGNGAGGLWLYDAAGDPIDGTTGDSHGYWRYTGSAFMEYLVVKGAKAFGIWHVDQLPSAVIRIDGADTTVFKWDFTSAASGGVPASWVGVWDPVDAEYQQAMSHVSLYGKAVAPVSAPGVWLLMLAGLAGLAARRRVATL